MPITGQFAADFVDFDRAATKAVGELDAISSGAAKVGPAIDRMVGSSAKGLDALAAGMTKAGRVSEDSARMIAGMSQQTTQAAAATGQWTGELDRAKGVVTSLASAFGITFSIGAVVGFGKELLDTANHLVKVSNQTGIFIDDVQRLDFVASQSGGTLEALTGAIGKMQLNLNDPKAQQALRNLGVDFAALSAANPYQQFELIAEAVGKVASPTQQAEAAVAIFGKTGLEILPQLKSKFKELADQATVSGDAQVRAINAAGDALDRQVTRAKNAALSSAGGFAQLVEKLGFADALMATLNPSRYAAEMAKIAVEVKAAAAAETALGAAQHETVDVMATYRTHLDEVRASADALSVTQKAMIKDGIALGESSNDIAAGLNLTTGAVEVYTTALRKADEAEKAAATKREAAEAKRVATAAAAVLTTTKLWDEYNALVVAGSGTTTDKQIADVQRWAADTTAEAIKAGTATKAFYEVLAKDTAEKLSQVGSDWAALSGKSREALQQAADQALADFDRMITSGKHFSRDVLDEQIAKYHTLQDEARGFGKAAVKAQDDATAAFKKHNAEIMAPTKPKDGPPESYTQSFDTVEQVLAAQGLSQTVRDTLIANITAKNKTAVAPSAPVVSAGGSGPLVGAGPSSGGGSPIVMHNYINGTGADVAKQMEAELLRSAKLKRLVGGR